HGPVSQHGAVPPGAAAPLGLSLAEPVGLRAGRIVDSARRIEPGGRLSCAGGRAACEADGGWRLLHVLRIMSNAIPPERDLPPEGGSHTALITGGTRGIGLGIARALAREHWSLALCGMRPEIEVALTLDELRQAGAPGVTYDVVDIASREQRTAFA